MRIGNLNGFIRKFETTTEKPANIKSSSSLLRYLLDSGKLLVMYVIIFQLMMQPITVLSQSKGILQVSRPRIAAKSNVKAKIEENTFEDFLPKFENKARQAVSDAFGADIPLPQMFGENGKLQSLLAGAKPAADKNRELIESALKGGAVSNTKDGRTTPKRVSSETAISINAPVLNSGLIAGSLRVAGEVPFNLNRNFHLTENLYTVGSPNISTGENSDIQGIVNEESDDLSGDYQVHLNGGRIDGNIHIHSVSENIFKDIPTGLPTASGTETVEINFGDDLKDIQDWSSVKSLIVNAAGLTIPVPAGNYEKITLNAPNRLVFGDGDYNFRDTIVFQKGSSIHVNGRTNIGIGKNLTMEEASIAVSRNAVAENVKITVLGSSVVLSGESGIEGRLRAVNATVIVNENSKITGQVIAGSLVMNGGTIAESSQTNNRVFGLKRYDRTTGAPNVYTDAFPRNTCQAPYTLKIYNGAADGSNRVSSATVKLNGTAVVAQNAFSQTVGYIERTVNLTADNTLEVRLSSNPGSYFNLEIVGTNCGGADTTAPVLTVSSPQNNATTTASAINVQGTATDNTGVSQVLVNNTQATYDAATKIWNLANFPLTLGANQITVRTIDNAGNQSTQTITVTRQPPVVDVTPPVLVISAPSNNSTVPTQTITVTGSATDAEPNASGLASVTVNGRNVNLSLNGGWTISGVALNAGANTITARAADNSGNITTQTITVTRESADATPPTVTITAPADNSETTASTVTVSGTVTDSGTAPSGVGSVTVNGQTAAVSGSRWSIENVSLTLGANVIVASATDNAGNSAVRQITVTRIESDTTAPNITITTPANNSETFETAITVSGTAADPGANASGVQSVTVNGQTANFTNGNWTINTVALNVGLNTITVRAVDVAGNAATAAVTVIRRERDTQGPTVTITSPANNYQTTAAAVTVSGTAVDAGANASGIQSVTVNGVNAALNGGTWTAANIPLVVGANAITAVARDNNNNTGSTAITIIRNPQDTQAPTISITSPINNYETFDSPITVTGTVVDEGAGATGVRSVTVNGAAATYNAGANSWSATVSIVDGVNTITAVAADHAPTPNQSQANIQVTKIIIQPPIITITNPVNGAFLSTNSVTVAGNVSSNKSDMTFAVTVNGQAANLAGREYTKTLNLNEGTNVITAAVTDALGQQSQQSVTVTNDRTPPTVYLINVPPVVNPGESYTIGAVAADAYGIADVEFTVNGASITRSPVAPFQFTLNIPLLQQPNVNLNISAIARDNAGLSATATARSITSGPSGLTGYVFDDATGYILPNADARLNNQTPLPTDENGLYSFISSSTSGIVLISKSGYTTVERSYSTTAGFGVEVFDARLTPLDSKANIADQNGSVAASDSANRIQAQFAPNSFPNGADVRLTSVSPQGLANLLPFGWSPVPDAVIDVRAAADTAFSNRSYPNPASLTILRVESLSPGQPTVLARYNSATHNWVVLQKNIFAGAGGTLQTSISADGQYAFLVADSGVTAPPTAIAGQNLPASAPASSAQLDSATAGAYSSPATALFSNTAKSRITFTADSTAKLPSGVSIEASFGDSYTPLIDPRTITVDRPSQDFVVYSFPAVSPENPNKLGAFFVAKPVRTDFGLSDLLRAKVHVAIYSGRLSQAGVLIGTGGGTVRGAEGSELEIPGGSVGNPQIVFFNKIPVNQTGVILPAGYETVGAFEVNLAGNTLGQTARISMPAISGDNSKIVVAKVISIAGQPGLKVVASVIENNSRLVSTVSQPSVPSGVNLVGIKDGGKYLFIRMPGAFGYIKGTVSSATQNTQAVKVTNTNTPFVDATVNNGTYTILGLANGESIQADGVSLTNDATGYGTTSLATQNAAANLPITLGSAALSVAAVTPINAATSVIVTTPVTVTFNKPISGSSVTGSNIKLVTANGNPVLTNLTIAAGGRSVVLTPASSLQSETTYKVQISIGIRDIYGNPLANAFESSFRTTNLVTVGNRLQPSQIRISYPNEQGFSTISIPAGAIPVGSVILAVNNSSGSTVSMIAGSAAIEIQIPARVGDEIELSIRQPDGAEYRVKQAAYRRADGFVSVGSNGGAITSEDGSLVLQVPPGAINGQANIKMTFAPESTIPTPREGEMAPTEMVLLGGVKIEAQGNFTNTEELHLELPAPANVSEGQRALVMKPSRINYNGSEIDAWETITSAKVEGGKIKTTSPPFIGISLVSAVIVITALSFWVFVPVRQRVVMGVARKQQSNGTSQPVGGAVCSIPTANGGQPGVFSTTNPNTGKFAISHNNSVFPNSANVSVLCVQSGVAATGLAYPYVATQSDSGIFGFDARYATVIFPPDSPVNLPPQISIDARTLNLPAGQIDTLRETGKVIVNSSISVKVAVTPLVESFTGDLFINGSLTSQLVWTQTQEGNSRFYETVINASTAGSYGILIKAQTVGSQANTRNTATYNFIALSDPNNCSSNPQGPPLVLSDSSLPRQGALQVDVGTKIHLEFSEPVKGFAPGTNIYLTEIESGNLIGGAITSGGLSVGANTLKCQIDFTPARRLKGGKEYKITLKTTVTDTDGTTLDEEFSRTFKTFQGSVITPAPIPDNSYRIAVVDDYIVTAEITGSYGNVNGQLKVYDFSTIFGETAGFEYKIPIGSSFISNRPLALTAFSDEFPELGPGQRNIVAVTTTAVPEITRPNNLWFYDITIPQTPVLVGVVSLSIPQTQTEIPVSVTVHNKRAYIGNVFFGGVLVVDVVEAFRLFKEEVVNSTGGDQTQNESAINRIRVRAIFPQGGFAQEARIQRGVYSSGPGLASPVRGVSVITQNNGDKVSPIAYYLSTSLPQLISFDFNSEKDGLLDFSDGDGDSKDDRWLLTKELFPSNYLQDLQAVSKLQLGGLAKDLVVAISPLDLYIFDVTNPKPVAQPENPRQYPAKSFVSLGLSETDLALKVEVDGTLAYVLFTDKVAVIDISDPNNPYLSTVITGIGSGLRWMTVKNGLLYTIGQAGIHVSVGRGLVQMVAYGVDLTDPEKICGNPVVIKSDTNEMGQPAGFYFQAFGHDRPVTSKIIVREVTLENNSRSETVLETIRNVEVFSTTAQNIAAGKARMNPRVIDPSKVYTAEIILDEGTGTELRSKQIEIPFSQLITFFPNKIALNKTAAFGEVNQTRPERTGKMEYGLAGAVQNVTFQIDDTAYPLFEKLKRPEPTFRTDKRPFGIIRDFLKAPMSLTPGRHSFRFSAKLKANPLVTEIREGELIVGDDPKDLRQPGSMVVNGVEVSKGNLAISENDLQIKGRGLSLEFSRSYNSQAADVFGPIGYGWRHSYQISLQQVEADTEGGTPQTYYVSGGEGGTQKFELSNMRDGLIPASAPNFGTLQKNADGSFDFYTKSRNRYRFRSALTSNAINLYLGNIDFIEEPNGNRLKFEYDTFGRLRTVRDSSDRTLVFDYELATTDFAEFQVEDVASPECPSYRQYLRIAQRIGQSQLSKKWRITRVHDESGIGVDYLYDNNGNLESVTRNADDEVNGITRNRVSQYQYNPLGTNRNPHLLKSVQSPNNLFTGAKTTYSYEITSAGIPMVSVIAMPEAVNNSFAYQFDDQGKVTQATFTDGNSNQTIYNVVEGRYVRSIIAPDSAVTTLEWTNFGQMRSSIDPEGKTTTIGYDLDNNPISQTMSGGGITISTVTVFDRKFSKMTSFTDGELNTTTYAVNETSGNIDEITLPTGRKIIFHYYANGDLKDTTDQYGTLTEFSNYDSYGNPQTITKQLGGGQTQVITQTFDARSRQRSSRDSLGIDVSIDYDNLDRPARQVMTDPTGFRETLTTKTVHLAEGQAEKETRNGGVQSYVAVNNYDSLQRLKKTTENVSGYGTIAREFTYDNNSNLLTEQNRRGITTGRTYNALNHLTKITQGGRTIWNAGGFGDVDKVGNPREVIDLYGNETKYLYDGLHRLIEKQLPENVTEKLEYDDNNNISASFDRNGKRTGYGYDPLNRVAQVTDALGRVTKWTYIDSTHRVKKESVSTRLTETTTLDGLERPVSQKVVFGDSNYETAYIYDGRNVRVTDARGTVMNHALSGYGEIGTTEVVGAVPAYRTATRYAAFGGVRQMTDALNRITTIGNDGFSRQRTINYNGAFSESRSYDGEGLMTERTDRRGVTSSQSYDDLGRKTVTRVTKIAPEAGFISASISYDDANSKEIVTDANQHSTVYEYDGLRRVEKMTNADGKVRQLIYDGENLREEGDFFNTAARRTKYVYDELNRVREIDDRKDGHTVINYSGDDLVKTTTDRRGNVTTETYDQLGRMTGADSYGKLASFTYDGNNNRLTQEDGLNNLTRFNYDQLNRLASVTHPNGLQTESYTYDAAGNVKTHNDGRTLAIKDAKYDVLNQPTEMTDGENNVTKYEYDGAGLLLSKTEPKGAGYRTNYAYNALGSLVSVTDADAKTWKFEYDDAQNLRFAKDALQQAEAARVTEYQYDALNRLTTTIQPGNRSTTYTYDNNSNTKTVTDPKNQTVAMNYDALDRLDDATYTGSGQLLTHDYKYDAEDNLFEVTETKNGQARIYRREYDTRNRLTKTTDGFNKSVNFGYDFANNLKTLTDASNRITTYNYDGKNQLDTVTQSSATIANYDWFADGLLKKVSYANNTARDYIYDNADRVTNIKNSFGAGQNESFDYGYDANSNRASEVRKENGVAKRTAAYNYDSVDRLKNVDYVFNVQTPNPPNNAQAQYIENSEQNSYGYDAVGNRINETNRTQTKTITLTADANGGITRTEQVSQSPELATTATFNARNELTQLNEPSGSSTFAYDENGNLSQVTKNAGIISKYEYDVRNQLTSAKDGNNNELAKFDYDFERKRISKQGANGYESYAYAGSQIVNEYNAYGDVKAKYTIGAGEVVKSEFANENNFHYTDALGSTTSLANAANGSLTSRNEYNAFGEVATANVNNVSSANSIGYTGQRLDNETGLMALGNGERYYSPSYARFIQQDSFAGMPNVPQSLNRFSYAHNNPNKFTDPSGHWIESAWDAISLGIGVYSFQDNYRKGNYGAAAIDAIGIVADVVALALPVIPGGVGVAIRASRGVAYAVKGLQTADRAINTYQAINNAGEEFNKGNYGWGALNAGFAFLGAKGFSESARSLSKLENFAEAGDVARYFRKYDSLADDWKKVGNFAGAVGDYGRAVGRGLLKGNARLTRELQSGKAFTGGAGEIIGDAIQEVADVAKARKNAKTAFLGSSTETVTTYRAQGGKGKSPIVIDDEGMVTIERLTGRKRQGVYLYLNFGDKNRAKQWITNKDRTEVVSFEVAKEFLNKVRSLTQKEHGITRDRSLPIKVDIDYPDQFGIPPSMLDELENSIIQGTGKKLSIEDFE